MIQLRQAVSDASSPPDTALPGMVSPVVCALNGAPRKILRAIRFAWICVCMSMSAAKKLARIVGFVNAFVELILTAPRLKGRRGQTRSP